MYRRNHSDNSYMPPEIDSSWRCTFDEEFDNSSVNWSKWKDGGQNWGSGGNGEQQGYTASACAQSGGALQMVGTHSPVTVQGRSFNYSSCMLDTLGTFKQAYGYFEFRGRIPSGQGYWPAFWLYDSAYQWPEIDVMENLGSDTSTYYMTYHYSSSGAQQYVYSGANLAGGYHTYAVKWVPGAISFYLDDTLQYTATSNVSASPMFILMNLAIGGNWPGSPNASTAFPGYFDVDYVRGWSMPNDLTNPVVPYPTSQTPPPPPPPSTTPTPVSSMPPAGTPAAGTPAAGTPGAGTPARGTSGLGTAGSGPSVGGSSPSRTSPATGGAPVISGPNLFQHLTRTLLEWAGVPVVIVSSAGIVYVLRDVLGHFVIMKFGPRKRMG
jgi:beta-glucanase (GH16 family)